MNQYDDIIHLPHHVSEIHPPMSRADRAAQFSPFAALNGYNDAVSEVSRVTEQQEELSEEVKETIRRQLNLLQSQIASHPKVTITYFQPDERKSGGAYVTVSGDVKKIDDYRHMLVLDNHINISIPCIAELSGAVFRD